MKRNFYLQHPIMAMNDPRMKKLIDKERLKGSGAYWFIIEKLALLPEPRAQLEYLQPFCVGRKIPLSYLQKIIREYDLFIFDEDNYFTPAELNPAKKKDEKSVENVSGTDVSVSENNRKVQKTSRKKAEKESLKVGNSLNGSLLPKDTPAIGKENIKDIKTTATTEEKEAAAADALSSPQTTPAPIEPWHTLIDKLTEESAWLDVACMHSGYGSLLKTHIKEAVEVFRQHVILHDNGNVLLNMKDTRQYFVNFVRAGQRTSQELHMLLQGLEKQQSAAAPPDPYRYELLVDGRRTYLGCPIPDGAPPRPDNTAFWNETARSWTSQTPPPSSKKPKQKPG